MSDLRKKLRLKEDTIVVLNRPEKHYFEEFDVVESLPSRKVNTVVVFVKDIEEFKSELKRIMDSDVVNMEGRILVAYPKKNNKKYDTFVHRDEIFPNLKVDHETGFIDGTDYKFNQMVSLDDVFTITGIKRTKESRSKTTPSQSVGDYEHLIDGVRKLLKDDKEALEFFDTLTPGYRRGWARHIFSAKRKETQDKRIEETIELLKNKIKTK